MSRIDDLSWRTRVSVQSLQIKIFALWGNQFGDELIERSLREAKTVSGADLACGAGTDHLVIDGTTGIDDVSKCMNKKLDTA